MILLTLFAVWALLFAWLGFSCWRAPVGYEDRTGFHYGAVPERDAPRSQRHRARRQARRNVETGRRLAI